MSNKRFEEAKAAFTKAKGTVYSIPRHGECEECGLPVAAYEERKGLHVKVSGICPNGHSFERYGRAAEEYRPEVDA